MFDIFLGVGGIKAILVGNKLGISKAVYAPDIRTSVYEKNINHRRVQKWHILSIHAL
jgi:hypothetical protein